ncbi:MAG: DUF190 domain-containing protein [Desulfovibrionaceae bacterium]|nr:DUF190 domain-containing protein [Desulfovibrionaceae bacterium]
MQGYLVTFFTQQNRTHEDMPLARWIIEAARRLGVRGATLFSGREGFGHDGRFHSENYFDLGDAPVQVAMALTAEECDALLARLAQQGLRVFYTKSAIEFGFTTER